jgi:hypothetical protein
MAMASASALSPRAKAIRPRWPTETCVVSSLRTISSAGVCAVYCCRNQPSNWFPWNMLRVSVSVCGSQSARVIEA